MIINSSKVQETDYTWPHLVPLTPLEHHLICRAYLRKAVRRHACTEGRTHFLSCMSQLKILLHLKTCLLKFYINSSSYFSGNSWIWAAIITVNVPDPPTTPWKIHFLFFYFCIETFPYRNVSSFKIDTMNQQDDNPGRLYCV